ncbi:MAG: serine--tRNA ligase [Verrucomicrobia bacterium]|nr:MAG: serine--tRNA ligase [Verrucomicrobiota bacterium]
MLDIKTIREREADVRATLQFKRSDVNLDAIIALDKERRGLLTEVETLKNQRNVESKKLGEIKKAGGDISAQQVTMRELGDRITEMDKRGGEIDAQLQDLLLRIPNIPHSSAPDGTDASGNVVARQHGTPKTFAFKPKTHVELSESLGILDFERATRLTGAGFPLYVGLGARLERALIQFMLDLHTREHGYTEVSTPFVVNRASMTGTGQLPKMAEDMYHVTADDLWLIPTAEVPITNIYREEIIAKPLPVYLTAYSPCFRREAGAAGAGTRGLIRVHQFDKVEMVKFVTPETSYDELEKLVVNAETVLQRLGLCYRVLLLCKGDMSFAAAKCYDIELWAPGQNGWLEVSSCSNFEDFQARRAGIRYRDAKGKTRLVHTLNGSGVALARLVVAIIENGQQPDGSIVLPEAIVPYMGGVQKIELPRKA